MGPTLEHIAQVALKHEVVAGIHGTIERPPFYNDMGYRLITVTTDFDVLTHGFRRAAGLEEVETGY